MARWRQLQCGNKQRHALRLEAEIAADNYFAAFGHRMTVYKCEYCRSFHIGHEQRRPSYRIDWDAIERSLSNGDRTCIDRLRRARLDELSRGRLVELEIKFFGQDPNGVRNVR